MFWLGSFTQTFMPAITMQNAAILQVTQSSSNALAAKVGQVPDLPSAPPPDTPAISSALPKGAR
jgi:hypothetical protein